MSDRTKIQRKKADTSTVTNSSLVSPTSPTLASPTCGFTSPQADTVLLKTQETQSSTEQPQQKETLKLQPLSHDISRISLRPQARLSVSQPSDPYEQEADSVASQVMRMQAPDQFTVLSSPDSLQRKFAFSCEQEQEIQRKASDSSKHCNTDIESQLSTKDGGSPLPDNVRAFMEPRFGSDFSQVRVHTDGEAVQMSRELGAQAFTYGSDVYFGAGKSPGNNELTAHELTHVVQQGGANPKAQAKHQETSNTTERIVAPSLVENAQGVTLINSDNVVQRDGGATAAAIGTGLAALGVLQNQVNASNGGLNYSSDQINYPRDVGLVPQNASSVERDAASFSSFGAFVDNKTNFVMRGDFGQDDSGKPVMANVRIELANTTTYSTSALSFNARALSVAYGTADDPKIRFACSGRFDPAGSGDCSYNAILEINKFGSVNAIQASLTNGEGQIDKYNHIGFTLIV